MKFVRRVIAAASRWCAGLLRTAGTLAMVAFLLISLLWIRSYWYQDVITLPRAADVFDLPSDESPRAVLTSHRGYLMYAMPGDREHGPLHYQCLPNSEAWKDSISGSPFLDGEEFMDLSGPNDDEATDWYLAPKYGDGVFQIVSGPRGYRWKSEPSAATMPAASAGSWKAYGPWSVAFLRVPIWAAELLLTPLVIIALVRWGRIWRNRHRAKGNFCFACGYDLRASPDRCPECGRVVDKILPAGGLISISTRRRAAYDAMGVGIALAIIALAAITYNTALHYSHWRPAGHVRLEVTETSLGQLPQGVSNEFLETNAVSADYRRLMYVTSRAGKQLLVVDGKEGPPYDKIACPTFSPDSKRYLYIAHDGGKMFLVVDGKPGTPYAWISDDDPHDLPCFSPDSRQVAYIAGNKDKTSAFVVVNQAEGKHYDGIGCLTFSPDSRHVAYVAHKSINDDPWSFSVVDGIEGTKITSSDDSLLFSDNSSHVLHWNDYHVLLDGVEQTMIPPDSYRENCLALSHDGGRVACVVTNPSIYPNFVLVIDGKTYAPPNRDDPPFWFSPDDKHFAYTSTVAASIDGEGRDFYSTVESQPFSPDGKHVIYVIQQPLGGTVSWDGREGGTHARIRAEGIVYSPDSRHFAAWAMSNNSDLALLVDQRDFQRIPGNTWYFDPVFSPDNKHLAYGYLGPANREDIDSSIDNPFPTTYRPGALCTVTVMVDGQKAGTYEPFMKSWARHLPLVFDSPTTLRGIAWRGREIIRFDIKIISD